MARYQADVWLGSASGRQRVYVNSNTWNGAREQIKTIYHVRDTDIWNLTQSRESSSSNSSVDGDAGAALVLGALFLLILAWRYILLISAIAFIIWLIIKWHNSKS